MLRTSVNIFMTVFKCGSVARYFKTELYNCIIESN